MSPGISGKTDEEIAADAQRGDLESFGALVERYEEKLVRYGRKFLANREDIKDLVQDAFIKAYMNIKGFDTERKFSPWMYRIAHNEFINAAKKKNRMPFFFDLDVLFPHPSVGETADEEMSRQEMARTLDECLEALHPKYREPLVLYFFEHMDYKTIAEILRVPVSTVGVRLKRGKAFLKERLRATA